MRSNYKKMLANINHLLEESLSRLERNQTSPFLTHAQFEVLRTRIFSLQGEHVALRDQKPGWFCFLLGSWNSNNPRKRLKNLMFNARCLIHAIEDAEKDYRVEALRNGPPPILSGNAAGCLTPQPSVSRGRTDASPSTPASSNTTYFRSPPCPEVVQSTAGSSRASLHSQSTSAQPVPLANLQSQSQTAAMPGGMSQNFFFSNGAVQIMAGAPHSIVMMGGVDLKDNAVSSGEGSSHNPVNHILPPIPLAPPE
ncbi:hypothetical protein HYDPIDRAFT_190189 [Hydnomerulius pinastri MD-312]|uniref:Uncharacterized protein n=1 Tax=Hydnomerulius pinastri MD-312 TaxID=994086 RepID=A0A0C9WA90_9AGAM|nr:hypothetical protein HYDPIDRAFT_190189 [Hydnomerulius pinastri MD-312]